jgi:predicted CopG family antitoxin
VEAKYWDGRRRPTAPTSKGDGMVKVITIMDDVYVDLHKLKSSKDMSFSELFRYMLSEMKTDRENIISFAGTVSELDVDHRAVNKLRREALRSR